MTRLDAALGPRAPALEAAPRRELVDDEAPPSRGPVRLVVHEALPAENGAGAAFARVAVKAN